ncbi:MAG: hypothetical protein V4760_03360 [Bdellovibrionota bacterium]
MPKQSRLSILAMILFIAAAITRFADSGTLSGMSTLSGALFLLGWAPLYWEQRPHIRKNRKIYDGCMIAVVILALGIIVSLAFVPQSP